MSSNSNSVTSTNGGSRSSAEVTITESLDANGNPVRQTSISSYADTAPTQTQATSTNTRSIDNGSSGVVRNPEGLLLSVPETRPF